MPAGYSTAGPFAGGRVSSTPPSGRGAPQSHPLRQLELLHTAGTEVARGPRLSRHAPLPSFLLRNEAAGQPRNPMVGSQRGSLTPLASLPSRPRPLPHASPAAMGSTGGNLSPGGGSRCLNPSSPLQVSRTRSSPSRTGSAAPPPLIRALSAGTKGRLHADAPHGPGAKDGVRSPGGGKTVRARGRSEPQVPPSSRPFDLLAPPDKDCPPLSFRPPPEGPRAGKARRSKSFSCEHDEALLPPLPSPLQMDLTQSISSGVPTCNSSNSISSSHCSSSSADTSTRSAQRKKDRKGSSNRRSRSSSTCGVSGEKWHAGCGSDTEKRARTAHKKGLLIKALRALEAGLRETPALDEGPRGSGRCEDDEMSRNGSTAGGRPGARAAPAAYPSELVAVWCKVREEASRTEPAEGVPPREDRPRAPKAGGGEGNREELVGMGPAALRARISRDFFVKLPLKEMSLLVQYFSDPPNISSRLLGTSPLFSATGSPSKSEKHQQPQPLQQGPVVDYALVRDFLALPERPPAVDSTATDRGETIPSSEAGNMPSKVLSSTFLSGGFGPGRLRRSILHEEAARAELAHVPMDGASRKLLERLAEAAAALDVYKMDDIFQVYQETSTWGPGTTNLGKSCRDHRRSVPCGAKSGKRSNESSGQSRASERLVLVEDFESLVAKGLRVELTPSEVTLLKEWFLAHPTGPEERAEMGHERDRAPHRLDFNHFLQQFWALGAAAKRRRRKEEAQERFLRSLMRRGLTSGRVKERERGQAIGC
ncbi:hypothetical protein NSK_006052 [Nannochloropsis salina CCMP1776]|uniref:Uncharacterized protein n=1 Tax=Nannochloropsis salina CCMP1776 TaxID=1027361 RepID=A0A4D9D1U4_9STRA|nr:hypothetical protein NSK_006052 [Nannochloropsis salina CCMP1776]|eukprot:TFJ82628.1 hypothetical protein NSK_006052 [Nannochloropsis salina CCMP1776]